MAKKNNSLKASKDVQLEEVEKEIVGLKFDLELDSEFQTQEGGLFSRFLPNDFYKFSKFEYFDNLTSPFSSYSYKVEENKKLVSPKLLVALDNNGLWFYLSYKESDTDESKNKILLNTHNYSDGLAFINSLSLEVGIDTLKELKMLK